MRDREIVGLHQAYLDVYSNLNYNQDIVEVVEYLVAEGYADSYEEAGYIIEDMSDDEYSNLIENENWENRRREASTRKPTTTPIRVGRKPVLRSSDIQQPDPEVTERRKRRSGRLQYTDMSEPQTRSGRRNLKSGMEYDTFDVILEHLVAEGYADTNESALAIMANMSEEWRESIVEGGFNSSGRYDVGGGRTVGPVAGAVRSLFSGNLPKGQTYVPPSPQKGTNRPPAVPSSKGDSGKLTDFGAGGGKAKLKTGMSVGQVERQGRMNRGDYSG